MCGKQEFLQQFARCWRGVMHSVRRQIRNNDLYDFIRNFYSAYKYNTVALFRRIHFCFSIATILISLCHLFIRTDGLLLCARKLYFIKFN